MTTDDRLREAMPRIVSAVHDVATELELTNEELIAALVFLAEVGRADEMILLSDVLGLSRLVDDQTHRSSRATPSNVLGPFYRPGSPWVDNPGSIVRARDAGTSVVMRGVVSDASTGRPIKGATIDVWQANAEGAYSSEDSSIDPWHLRGRQLTDAAGCFEINTIVPKHYTVKNDGPVGRLLATLGRHPWRPAHIHVLVEADGYVTLVTQTYIADGPYLEDDAIDGVKASLIRSVVGGELTFDLELESLGERGTVGDGTIGDSGVDRSGLNEASNGPQSLIDA
jgi:protocatechuate 3,4-dioxygenase beta subunit